MYNLKIVTAIFFITVYIFKLFKWFPSSNTV